MMPHNSNINELPDVKVWHVEADDDEVRYFTPASNDDKKLIKSKQNNMSAFDQLPRNQLSLEKLIKSMG